MFTNFCLMEEIERKKIENIEEKMNFQNFVI